MLLMTLLYIPVTHQTAKEIKQTSEVFFFIMIYLYLYFLLPFSQIKHKHSQWSSQCWVGHAPTQNDSTHPGKQNQISIILSLSYSIFITHQALISAFLGEKCFQVRTQFSVPGVSCWYCWQWSMIERAGEGSILRYLDYGRDKTLRCPHQRSSLPTFAIMGSCEKSLYVI